MKGVFKNVSIKNKILFVFAAAAAVFGVDQFTKHIVVQHVEPLERIPVIGGFFDLTLRYNTGAAFSFFSTMPLTFFVVISVLAMGMLLFFVVQLDDVKKRQYIALGGILGGAIGNLCDRFRIGGVADFLLLHYKSFSWPAFNVADIAIVCGVFVFLWENSPLRNTPLKEE